MSLLVDLPCELMCLILGTHPRLSELLRVVTPPASAVSVQSHLQVEQASSKLNTALQSPCGQLRVWRNLLVTRWPWAADSPWQLSFGKHPYRTACFTLSQMHFVTASLSDAKLKTMQQANRVAARTHKKVRRIQEETGNVAKLLRRAKAVHAARHTATKDFARYVRPQGPWSSPSDEQQFTLDTFVKEQDDAITAFTAASEALDMLHLAAMGANTSMTNAKIVYDNEKLSLPPMMVADLSSVSVALAQVTEQLCTSKAPLRARIKHEEAARHCNFGGRWDSDYGFVSFQPPLPFNVTWQVDLELLVAGHRGALVGIVRCNPEPRWNDVCNSHVDFCSCECDPKCISDMWFFDIGGCYPNHPNRCVIGVEDWIEAEGENDMFSTLTREETPTEAPGKRMRLSFNLSLGLLMLHLLDDMYGQGRLVGVISDSVRMPCLFADNFCLFNGFTSKDPSDVMPSPQNPHISYAKVLRAQPVAKLPVIELY